LRNAYFDGGWKYLNSAPAARFALNDDAGSGGFAWFYAGSGTAGNAISFTQAMTLDASGNLAVGKTSASYRVDIAGAYQTDSGYYINGNTSGGFVWVRDNYALRFGTNDTERMRLDASGNLGLGVTPSAWGSGYAAFDIKRGGVFQNSSLNWFGLANNAYHNGTNWIYKESTIPRVFRIQNDQFEWLTAPSGTAGNAISFTQAMTLDANSNLLTGGLTSYPGQADANSTANGAVCLNTKRELRWNSTNASIYGGSGGGDDNLYYHSGLAHIWRVSGTERARISSGGDLLVGTTSLGAWDTRLTLSSDTGTTKWGVGPYSTATNFVISASASAGVYLAGTTATSWSSVSDERHKDIIEPIANAAEKVCTLRAVIGKYKADETNTRKSFLIAQDVLAVLPEAVDISNPERFGLAYSDMVPLLVAAIQEQQALITDLRARVAQLEAK
jgi:hypothetical protein